MATSSTRKPRKSVKNPAAPKARKPKPTPPPPVDEGPRPGFIKSGKSGWIKVGGEEE